MAKKLSLISRFVNFLKSFFTPKNESEISITKSDLGSELELEPLLGIEKPSFSVNQLQYADEQTKAMVVEFFKARLQNINNRLRLASIELEQNKDNQQRRWQILDSIAVIKNDVAMLEWEWNRLIRFTAQERSPREFRERFTAFAAGRREELLQQQRKNSWLPGFLQKKSQEQIVLERLYQHAASLKSTRHKS